MEQFKVLYIGRSNPVEIFQEYRKEEKTIINHRLKQGKEFVGWRNRVTAIFKIKYSGKK